MTNEELEKRFSYHAPKDNQPLKYDLIRSLGELFARTVNILCPECREKSAAVTRIEEAVMWANAAIARREE